MATYYFDSVNGDDSYTPAQAQNIETPWKTPGGPTGKSLTTALSAGDKLLLKRGCIFYGTIIMRSSGVEGNPIILGAYGEGEPPIVRATAITTGWIAEANANGGIDYKVPRDSEVQGTEGGMLGVWEDDAPLFVAESRDMMRPGTFWYDGSANLYIRLYGNDHPDNHAIEVSTKTNSGARYQDCIFNYYGVSHYTIQGLILERARRAGVFSTNPGQDVGLSINHCIIRENEIGIAAKFGSLFINHVACIRNIGTSLYLMSSGSAQVTIRNSILANTLGHTNLLVQSGNTVDIDNSIDIGIPRGRYWLKNAPTGGTIIFGENYKNVNPRFISAGAATGLSASLMSIGHAGLSNGTQEAYLALKTLKDVDPTFNMSAQQATEWTDTPTGDAAGGTWAAQAAYVALGGEVAPCGRNHLKWASGTLGTPFTYILYLGISAPSASYSFDGRFLKTIVNNVPDLNIDTSQTINGFDCSILGWSPQSGKTPTGLIGYILSLNKGYSIGYAHAGPVNPHTSGGSYGAVATSVLSIVDDIDIAGTQSVNIPFNYDKLWETEFWNASIPFAHGTSYINEYNKYIDQQYSITKAPIAISWPYSNWTIDQIRKAVINYKFKGSIAAIYNSNIQNAAKNLYNQFYPGAMPILFPQSTSENFVFKTAQDGIDEAENQSAWLQAWDGSLQIFGEYLVDIDLSAIGAFAETVKNHGLSVREITFPMTSLETKKGSILDHNSLYLPTKIIPKYDLRLQTTSAGYNSTSAIEGLTTDIAGLQYPNPLGASIGPYESTPPAQDNMGLWAKFDGTMPALELLTTQNNFTIDQVQVWKTKPSMAQIRKVLGL